MIDKTILGCKVASDIHIERKLVGGCKVLVHQSPVGFCLATRDLMVGRQDRWKRLVRTKNAVLIPSTPLIVRIPLLQVCSTLVVLDPLIP